MSMRIVVPPNAELDPKTRTLVIPGRSSNTLSDHDLHVLSLFDLDDLEVEIHEGGGVGVQFGDSNDLCWAEDMEAAYFIVKCIYAATRHTTTQEHVERLERAAYRRGVTIQPGRELRGEEIRDLPIGSVIAAKGCLFERKADRWCDANGNLVPTPERAWFVACTKEPCTLQDDEDDDFEALHDCCEQCGTDWEEDDE
nr:MAG TPA: hypothetical protein [Caudoviricetes sp.]